MVFVDYDEQDSYNDAHHHRPQAALYPALQSNGTIAASNVTTNCADASSQSSSSDIAAGCAETLNLDAFGRSLSCYP